MVDNIIIGSGVGGLATAICLSKQGQSVLVLEQHEVPGGWCHSFYIDGQRFSPGVHYIGQMGEGESTRALYESLEIANDLTFFRMNPQAYEHCWIGDKKFDIPAHFENWVSTLSELFPHEKKGLKKYLELVKRVSEQLNLIPEMEGLWDHITIPYRTRHMGKYGLFSLKRVINWFVKDPLLQCLLNIQCGDYGLSPERASFPVHCAVMDHYANGGYYPMGGGGAIVKAMTKQIKKNQGQIRTKTGVKRIILEGKKKKKAIGVELENGEVIHCKRVISNADPETTYRQFVGEENLSKRLLKKLNRTKYSCTSLMLFLTVEMDLREAGMDSGNIWRVPHENLDDIFKQLMSEKLDETSDLSVMFISCPTIKDPTSYNGKYHTLEVITFIDYKSFAPFSSPEKRKAQAYLDYKEMLSEKMIQGLEGVIPGVSEHIVQKELGTPLTNEFYIRSTLGSVYGTEKTLRQMGPGAYKPKSEIEGLFLCGASILSHGIAGATFSGVQTAANILGVKQKDLLVKRDDQELKVFDAEDPEGFSEEIRNKIYLKQKRVHSSID